MTPAGAKGPKLVTRDMRGIMKKGAVLVDVAIDPGGCFETATPTTRENPICVVDGIMHDCGANMPGAAPKTSTMALTSATRPLRGGNRQPGLDKGHAGQSRDQAGRQPHPGQGHLKRGRQRPRVRICAHRHAALTRERRPRRETGGGP